MCDIDISVLSLLEKWPLEYWNSFVNCRCRSVLNCIFYHSFSYLELKPLLIEAVHKVIEVQTCKKAKVNSTLEGFCPFKIVCNLHCLSGYAIRFSHAVLVCLCHLPVVYNRTEMTLVCFCCSVREHPFLLLRLPWSVLPTTYGILWLKASRETWAGTSTAYRYCWLKAGTQSAWRRQLMKHVSFFELKCPLITFI